MFYLRSNRIFISTYQETISNSEIKAIEITNKIQQHISNIFYKYLTDLLIIGKHALLLNGKKGQNYNTEINKESNVFNINNKQKEIINAKRKRFDEQRIH